jgi:drug/metabolite transporter (DMT)-like permease
MAPRAQGGEGVAPLAMTHARMIGTAVLLWALVATGRSRTKVSQLPGDHARVFGLAVLGIAVNQSLFIAGLSRTSSSTWKCFSGSKP